MGYNNGDRDFLIRPLDSRSWISSLQCCSKSAFICIGLAFVGMSFSEKLSSYGRSTMCCFLFQKALGNSEQICCSILACRSMIFFCKSEFCNCLLIRQKETWFCKSCKWNCFPRISALIWYVCMDHALIKFKFLVLDFSKNGKTSLMPLILVVIQS